MTLDVMLRIGDHRAARVRRRVTPIRRGSLCRAWILDRESLKMPDMPTTTRTFEVHEIQQEFTIHATPARVWKALVEETNSWWHRDFYTGRDPRGFHIEARLGGAMWEDWGQGQGLVWGTVIGLRRNEFLQVSGLIDAQFGGPAGLISTWRLEAHEGGTKLRFHESTWGAASEATRNSLDVGWRFLFGRCLKDWIEKGERVTDPAPTS